MLRIEMYVARKVDSDFQKGVADGLETYLSENKVRNYSIEKCDEFDHLRKDKYGQVLARASAFNLLNTINGGSNLWKWAVINKIMVCPEYSVTTAGYFRTPEPFRPDVCACIISSGSFNYRSKEYNYANGLLVGYHELSAHHRAYGGHCNNKNCVNSEYDTDTLPDLFFENNEIPKCKPCKNRKPRKIFRQ